MAKGRTAHSFISAPSSGSNTSVSITTSTSTTAFRVDRPVVARDEKDRAQELRRIEAAVFSHIKALRALGKTLVNTAEISDALSISRQEVERAIKGLEQKGVRRVG